MMSLPRISLIFLILLCVSYSGFAQYFTPTTLPNGTENASYVENLSIIVPPDSMIGPFIVPFDSVIILTTSDLPPGLTINCTNPSCTYIAPFPPVSSWPVNLTISGTPTTTGSFDIDFQVSYWFTTAIGVAAPIVNYTDAVSITIDAGTPTASVPTLSEWGLIVLSLLLCTVVTVAIRRKQIETI